MVNTNYLLTSESVSEGHPDKMADQISDGILDALLAQDPMSRVACETSLTTGLVLVFGEITSKADVDIRMIVRDTIRKIGYDDPSYGFDCDACAILIALDEQSVDISAGVTEALEVRGEDAADEVGAGDQGMMIGYAANETPSFMPLPIDLAHKLTKRLSDVRRDNTISYLRPDTKSQVTVEYTEDHKPVRVDTIVISAQHDPDATNEQIATDIQQHVIRHVVPGDLLDVDTKYYINPSGRFVIGGPVGDAGLTGRKIIVDTYGGMGRHGGGAFSGKDPSKVDRSAAYMGRYVAKNIVASGLAKRCEIQFAYAIGYPDPVSVYVDTFGTGILSDEKISDAVQQVFNFKPANIVKQLNLLQPIYSQTTNYGHFGKVDDLETITWEKTNKVTALKRAVK